MSIVTKITWATTEINDRNLHKVKEEKFEAAASDIINKLYLEMGDTLWSCIKYSSNGNVEIQYPVFDEGGKYTGRKLNGLLKKPESKSLLFL